VDTVIGRWKLAGVARKEGKDPRINEKLEIDIDDNVTSIKD
jgi:hypothetical protein